MSCFLIQMPLIFCNPGPGVSKDQQTGKEWQFIIPALKIKLSYYVGLYLGFRFSSFSKHLAANCFTGSLNNIHSNLSVFISFNSEQLSPFCKNYQHPVFILICSESEDTQYWQSSARFCNMVMILSWYKEIRICNMDAPNKPW